MIRVYKEFLEQCLMILLYQRHSHGLRMDQIVQYVSRSTWPDEIRTVVKASTFLGYTAPDSLDDLIKTTVDQLLAINVERKSGEDGNLINAIVRILQLPFSRNMIGSGNTLKALRTALLLPEEMGGLVRRLEARELTCVGCSRPLRQEEMVTISQDGQGVMLMCHACMRPTVMACDHEGCTGHAGLDKKYRAMHKKTVDCGGHAVDAETGEIQQGVAPAEVRPGAVGVRLTQAARRVTFRERAGGNGIAAGLQIPDAYMGLVMPQGYGEAVTIQAPPPPDPNEYRVRIRPTFYDEDGTVLPARPTPRERERMEAQQRAIEQTQIFWRNAINPFDQHIVNDTPANTVQWNNVTVDQAPIVTGTNNEEEGEE